MNGGRAITVLVSLASVWAMRSDAITLDTLMKTILEKNPEIQKAKCGLEQASGRRLVFRSVAWPKAIVGIAGGVQGGHRAGDNSIEPFGFAYGVFTQPLFNSAVPATLRRGDVEILIAQQQLNVAIVEQLHSARLAFYSALYNRSLKNLRQDQRQQLEENASGQKARYESGLTDRGALVGAEVQTRELDPRIETAQRAYDEATLKLTQAIGNLDSSTNLPQPDGELEYKRVDLDIGKEAETASRRRADLKLARVLIHAAREEQRIIEAGYYPGLNAVVGGEYIPTSGVRRDSEGAPRKTDDTLSSEARTGAAYTWRVVDNGKVYGATMKQRSAREINEATLRKLEADVPRDLARIRNNLQAIATKREALVSGASTAEQTATTVQQNVAEGVVSQLEFRLAENALLDIKSALLNLAYQQNVALAEWDRASGRYFQFSDDSP
jgi:outer membrane protein TolC